MSSFNQYFKTKGADLMVNKLLNGIDDRTDYKLTNLTWELVDEELPANHYLENALTASFKVIVSYSVDNGEILKADFEVPKEIDGAFIIEGSYRSAINTLGSDNECRFYLNTTSGRHSIMFDYDRSYYIDSGELVIKRTDPNLGLPEKARTYKLSEIDNVSGLEKEALRLTENQIKKLQIKLDLDYTPEYITSKLINECISYGDDRYKDTIIDKKIETVSQGFEEHLFGRKNQNSFKIRRYIINYWIKYKRLMESINMITSTCIKYWKGSQSATKGDSTLQSSGGINAINMHVLSSKIKLSPSVAYNQSMSDLICIGDTPISQNVGLQNSLTISTHLTENGGVDFDVFDTDFKKIRIPYIDYLNKKVCASEYVDYETKQVKPNDDGEVEVKHRMRRKMVPVDEIELIDLHPDYRLSETARRIPFLNYTDSVRVHMGTAMLKQAIPLAEAERPLVDTGNYEELDNNILNDKFSKDEGTVKEITDDEVIIELPNGKVSKMQRRSSIKSLNDVNIYSEPKVKVGQKVRKGDVILGAVGLEKDTYKSGLNALVLFHAMFGLVNEDALVVSESFAEKMRSYSLMDLSYDVCYNSALKEILPIGSKVTKGDKILTAASTVELDEVNSRLSNELGIFTSKDSESLRELSDLTKERYLTVPNNIFEATISDVLIQENKDPYLPGSQKLPDLTYSHTSKNVIKSYDMDRKVIYDNFPEYIAADRLKPIDMKEKDYNVVYTVRIRLIMKTKLMKGSKLTNRYGGKGVISKILPDKQMPVMVDSMGKKKIVDIVMNPYSTVNRKIPGVNMENLLGNCAMKIHDLVEDWKDDPKKKEKIMPLVQKYYPGRYDDMSVDKFIKLHNTKKISEVYYFNVGSYSKLTPEKLDEWAKELGVSSQYQILIPANTVSDLDELKENLPEDEYKEVVKGMEGKYVPVNKPLTVGYMTMLELYHIPTYSNKVTSSMFGVDVNEWKDSPIMGAGEYRKTGQKIDEMALNALLARGASSFIEEVRKDTYKEDNQTFLNNLLGLGLTITDKKGYNQGGSDLKNRLGEMKIKFRRKK